MLRIVLQAVADGIVPDVDVEFGQSAGSLAACWEAEDVDSQVDHFSVRPKRVLEDGTSEYVGEWQSVPRAASEQWGVAGGYPFVRGVTCGYTSSSVQEGGQYVVAVRAYNPLSLFSEEVSTGITVDWTAPHVGVIHIGDDAATGVSASFQTDSSAFTVAWANITEDQSSITDVSIGLGTRPGLDDLRPRSSLADVAAALEGSSITWDDVFVRDGQTVVATVWAANAVGLVSRRSSGQLLVDTSAPRFLELPHIPFAPQYSFPFGFNAQPTFPESVSGGTIIVPLSSFLDAHSGITSLGVTVRQAPTDPSVDAGIEEGAVLPLDWTPSSGLGATTLLPFTEVDISEGVLNKVFTGIVLTNNTYVWVEATVTNGVGLTLQANSRAELVSTETLRAGFVNDGFAGDAAEDDGDFQESTTSYSARWNGFTDPKSDIWYEVALGTSPGSTELRDWHDVGLGTSFDVLQNFSVAIGTTVYATVRARNSLGVVVNATSNGMVLGTHAPEVFNIQFENSSPAAAVAVDALTGAQYVDATPVVVSWNATDDEAVASCVVNVRDAPGAPEPLLSATTSDGVFRVEWDVAMPEGQTMYADVSCTDIRGRSTSVVASTWAVVETTPPVAGTVSDGYADSSAEWVIRGNASHATAHWFGFDDPESHIVSTTACLGNGLDACGVARVEVGQDSSVELFDLPLTHGDTYVWTINVTSGSGMSTSARSNGWTVDALAPDASSAFVIDVIGNVVDGDSAIDADSSADASFLEVMWAGFADVDSGISHFVVMLGWAPGADDIAASVTLDAASSSHSFGDLQTALAANPGARVYSTVVAYDVAGHSVSVSSDGIQFDDTPPALPATEPYVVETLNATVTSTQAGDTDVMSTAEIRAAWGEFTDAESGVARYEVRVEDVTDVDMRVMLNWSDVGSVRTFTHKALPLQHSRTYIIRVRAVNGIGLTTEASSDGVSLDLTPPSKGVVHDATASSEEDVDMSASIGSISARWSAFVDDESAIASYVWCVGTAPGSDDVVPCHDVADVFATAFASPTVPSEAYNGAVVNVEALLTPVYGATIASAAAAPGGILKDGTLAPSVAAMLPLTAANPVIYFSTVTAVNEVGLRRTAYSDGVQLDLQPPVVGMVMDSPDVDVPDVDVQSSLTTITASWLGFVEHQSSLDRFEVSVGTTPGGSDVVDALRVVPTASQVSIPGLALTTGTRYYTTVAAYDAAGLWAANTTNGVTVDATGPVPVFVSDRADGYAGDASDSRSAVRAAGENANVTLSWAFDDAETGVASYRVRLCPELVAREDVPCALAWTDMGLRTSVELTGPSLAAGVRYVADVEATSGSGVTSVASSHGFIVDGSEPVAGTATVVDAQAAAAWLASGGNAAQPPVFETVDLQSSWGSIAVQWSGFEDPESAVTGYTVCAGTSPQADNVAPCRDVGLVYVAVLDASAASPFFDAGNGPSQSGDAGNFTSFYVTVYGRNGVNLTATAVTSPTQVDASPPVIDTVFAGRDDGGHPFTASSAELCVAVEGAFDAESGIDHFELCGGTAAGDCNVWAPMQVSAEPAPATGTADSTLTVLCARGLSLQHHQTIFVSAIAVNGAGLSTSVAAPGVVVVLVDPTPGTVVDIVSDGDSLEDVDVYGERRTVSGAWYGFAAADNLADIVSYEVAVCGAAAGCNNQDNQLSFFAPVGLASNVSLSSMGLEEGETYHWHVRATDASGRSVTAMSDGFIIDTTPPTPGQVAVVSFGTVTSTLSGNGINITAAPLSDDEVDYLLETVVHVQEEDASTASASLDSLWHDGFAPLHVAWRWFGDAQTAIDHYTVCVSTGRNVNVTDDLFPCRTVSAHTSYTVFTADDVNQTFVEWAHTTAQAATVAAVVVPPVVDPETGLAVNATTEEPVEVRAVFEAQVTIEACNTVGLCTPVDAAPASVDLTPPQTVAVSRKLHPSISLFDGVFLADDDFAGEHYTTDTHRWSAAWTGGDDSESGVAFFTVSVIDVDSGVAVAGPRNVGKSKWFAVDNLALEHGHMYITEVTTYVHGAAIGARAVCVLVS